MLHDKPDGGNMNSDEYPVTPVFAVSINRERLSFDHVENHQRYQLFRKLIGAIIIRAI